MQKIATISLFICALQAQTAEIKTITPWPGVIRVTGNFPRDLLGPDDTRPNTWGRSEAAELPIKFNPPAGYRVRVLKLRGDMTAYAVERWELSGCRQSTPTFGGCNLAVPAKGHSGTLLGFSTTGPEGSKHCTYCADNTLVYIQDGIKDQEYKRTPFKWKLHDVLGSDSTLVLKIATFLNTMGVPIHIEATWQAEIEYIPEKQL